VIAGLPGALNLWGHGARRRDVIVPGDDDHRLLATWVRRFLCRSCGVTCSVSAEGVLARHTYTLTAILTAWCYAVTSPIGDGQDDEEVYALVGVDLLDFGEERHRSGARRWRSLSRWTASIPTWWPARSAVGATWRQRATTLLAGFVPGEGGRGGALRRALAAHAAGGRPM
jgi:hypothetical protein